MERTKWFKDAVIYQIYPRSFCDADGDGIGDIRGIISKLDYLKDLGINCVWLSPCYKSPNRDNGYDISDYKNIMDEFGTMDDWDEMIKGMHDRGIRLIMDLVSNHTSDEHFWFKEALKSRDNPYHDYYIFREGRGKNKMKVPNNWSSRFGGHAWTYNEPTRDFYLHLFTPQQPDLNWDNPKVREEIKDVVKFWLDKGCDGFRCDVITYISKREGLPNGKFNPFLCGDEHFTHGPRIHEYLHELYADVLSRYDCMTVGEGPGVGVKESIDYTDEKNGELDTVFSFEHVNVDRFMDALPIKFKLKKLKAVFDRYQTELYGKGWNSLYFENHDQPRSIPRFVGDYGARRKEAAKMLAIALYMMQGTAYIFEGQEIGMTDYPWKSVDEMDDIVVTSILKTLDRIKIIPWAKKIAFKAFKIRGRDNARTPMQWNKTENAGFTTGKPWLAVNPNYKEINVEDNLEDPNSILNFYKKLIAFRKGNEIIINGTFKDLCPKRKDIFCYEREWNGRKLFVVANFKNKETPFVLPEGTDAGKAELKLSNYAEGATLKTRTLRPYEAFVFGL